MATTINEKKPYTKAHCVKVKITWDRENPKSFQTEKKTNQVLNTGPKIKMAFAGYE